MITKECKICKEKVTGGKAIIYCKSCLLKLKKEYMDNYHKIHKSESLIYNKRYYEEHINQIKENWKLWYRKNKKRIAQKRKQDYYLIQRRKYAYKYKKKYPEKDKAHKLSKNISKLSYCERCFSNKNLEKHHPNYSKPLEIITLCKRCHTEEHYGDISIGTK
jgi:hypothetical protein